MEGFCDPASTKLAMIILNAQNSDGLWQKIRTAARERRIEDLEHIGGERLALLLWPTRHVRLHLQVIVNRHNNRISILEQDGDIPCSEFSRLRQQKRLLNHFRQLFPTDINAGSIVRLSSPFNLKD